MTYPTGTEVVIYPGPQPSEASNPPADDTVYNRQPLTILEGLDFNALFDQIMIYNVPATPVGRGPYTPITPLAKNHSDRFYIQTVFAHYIETPWKKLFDYNTYVEDVGNSPSPETPFTVETGQSLRVFMQSLSQMTNAIWYFDPYYALHNHHRANANSPRAITDGTGTDGGGDPTGGVHCRDLIIIDSIENMANDNRIWGTLAETVEGEVISAHRTDADTIEQYGLWQYMEFRADLHLQSHVSERAGILQSRANRRIRTATLRLFEKGFQAGQVASLFSDEWGVAQNLPILGLTMTFLASQEPDGDIYYGIPAYDLVLSNDPQPAFDLYDALPWENFDYGYAPSHPRFQMPHLALWSGSSGNTIAVCDEYTPVFTPDCGAVLTQLPAGPYCVVMATKPGATFISCAVGFGPSYGYRFGNISFGGGAQAQYLLGRLIFTLRMADFPGNFAASEVSMDLGASEAPIFLRAEYYVGGIRAKVWRQTEHEPDWMLQLGEVFDSRVTAGYAGAAPVGVNIDDGFGNTDYAIGAMAGWNWFWFTGVIPGDFFYGEVWQNTPANTWTSLLFPAGSRPSNPGAPQPDVLDAITGAGGNFPRGDTVVVTNNDLGGSSGNLLMNKLRWGFSYIPAAAAGNFDEPRMLDDTRNYVGFTAPLGATSVELRGVAYINAPATGIAGIGDQPGPTGEGAIQFEMWVSDYRGSTAVGDPNHVTIGAGVSPDYNFHGSVQWAFPFSYSAAVTPGQQLQIGGKITSDWGELMRSHLVFGPILAATFSRTLELRIKDVRLRYYHGPDECGDSDVGPCADEDDAPELETGWGSEVVTANRGTGAFTSRLPVVVASLNVYRRGKLLTPEVDWAQVGASNQSFVLTSPGARCLRLVYLVDNQSIATDPSTSRVRTGDVFPDQARVSDIRGL